ncbi:dTDP-4-dehydrorhamnose 3,5-epimerase [Mumia sp. zg.B21]|uniref:dTDP-4-dehydrorhamnose 3,5-epimerase n=1 Tax=Mumia sp. zg.B21 TaxID=2855447 RepID=UPI001C6E2D32|nr:dTDP-4-dehydrorhamnose 3,5-epimerase [Mumia sp. zg.B21]MBW9210770.1 dTDP-4-dehydrorhamnose 3,5-epimerase [Mumia sp. zg.B21]
MDVQPTSIPGLMLLTPTPHRDARGFFSRTFDSAGARSAKIDPAQFVQDSVSRSARGVVRGLHVRVGQGEAKLVRCSYGEIFDVVVDLRPDSPAYLTWQSFRLSGDTQRSVYIPPGCAHGFQALSDPADTSYRISREHDPSEDLTIAYDDPTLAIPWPSAPGAMSDADRSAPHLADLATALATIETRVAGGGPR